MFLVSSAGCWILDTRYLILDADHCCGLRHRGDYAPEGLQIASCVVNISPIRYQIRSPDANYSDNIRVLGDNCKQFKVYGRGLGAKHIAYKLIIRKSQRTQTLYPRRCSSSIEYSFVPEINLTAGKVGVHAGDNPA
jgi:hypothetical protein